MFKVYKEYVDFGGGATATDVHFGSFYMFGKPNFADVSKLAHHIENDILPEEVRRVLAKIESPFEMVKSEDVLFHVDIVDAENGEVYATRDHFGLWTYDV